MHQRFRRGAVAVCLAVVTAATLALTGCSTDKLAEQYRSGSGKNFIAGDGSITEIPVTKRGEAISFDATTLSGEAISSAQFAGTVLVVNFWYAGCAPCRAEAKDLETVYQRFAAQGVAFVGVNVRDGNDTALAFHKTFGITYPSISDISGKVQLAFSSTVPPNAVPTTLVLDKQGRVAARILGRISDKEILATLVSDQVKAQ